MIYLHHNFQARAKKTLKQIIYLTLLFVYTSVYSEPNSSTTHVYTFLHSLLQTLVNTQQLKAEKLLKTVDNLFGVQIKSKRKLKVSLNFKSAPSIERYKIKSLFEKK